MGKTCIILVIYMGWSKPVQTGLKSVRKIQGISEPPQTGSNSSVQNGSVQ